jgi:hypothetical protein
MRSRLKHFLVRHFYGVNGTSRGLRHFYGVTVLQGVYGTSTGFTADAEQHFSHDSEHFFKDHMMMANLNGGFGKD